MLDLQELDSEISATIWRFFLSKGSGTLGKFLGRADGPVPSPVPHCTIYKIINILHLHHSTIIYVGFHSCKARV
ncbi:hypothetical protein BRADI_1g14615v3 [Brachypodium distachyon]|uniref:Uncharacterized protein n=1 Tax=Brachypodium distachyon TaxID=15368 RepID=A0A2K2DJI1_BRADI|nr:hypothetical protein BRADI_1g14615v3 [Brachypodium distachyon]